MNADRVLSYLRMFQELQASMMGTPLRTYSKRLPKWGTMRNGDIFALRMSAHPIPVSAGSAWPTPTSQNAKHGVATEWEHSNRPNHLHVMVSNWPTPVASDADKGAIIGADDTYYETSTGMPRKVNRNGKDGSVGLGRLVQIQQWPTPTATDVELERRPETDAYRSETGTVRRKNADGTSSNLGLAQIAKWATPVAGDWKDSGAPAEYERNSLALTSQSLDADGLVSGKLNPDWVETLMGLPLGWTDLSLTPPPPDKHRMLSSRRVSRPEQTTVRRGLRRSATQWRSMSSMRLCSVSEHG